MFERGGHIFNPCGRLNWAVSHALQPTPILTNEGIKVSCGFRDEQGVSRVGYVLLDSNNPKNILRLSTEPVFNIGQPGYFDDNGVVPCFIHREGLRLYMYYAGYQLVNKVKFLVFGGLAVSDDDGESFQRVSNVPFTDRTDNEPFFKVIHSLINVNNEYIFYYGGGDSFVHLNNKVYPKYNIRFFKSKSYEKSDRNGFLAIDFKNDNEYRVARPFVYKSDGIYCMLYYIAEMDGSFYIAQSLSKDGTNWVPDEKFTINGGRENWDSQMMAYPSFVEVGDSQYIFYNGNDYGRDGFGFLYKRGI
jgi:predicted GH43/DUF377 family glycosyl hydrolase